MITLIILIVFTALQLRAAPWAIVNYNDCDCVTSIDILVDTFLKPLQDSGQILGYAMYTSPLRCKKLPARHDFSFLSEEYPELGSLPSRPDTNSIGKAFVQGVRDYYDKYEQKRHFTQMSGFLMMNDDTFFRSKTMDWSASWMSAERDVVLTDISSGTTPRHANTWPQEARFRHWRPDVFAKMKTGLAELRQTGRLIDVHRENLRLNANGQEDRVSFHQVDLFFIHSDSADTFVGMIMPFLMLGMNPEIYIPYVYRMMFSPCPLNFFVMPHRSEFSNRLFKKAATHQGFFAIHGVKLLKSCTPPVVDDEIVALVKQFN